MISYFNLDFVVVLTGVFQQGTACSDLHCYHIQYLWQRRHNTLKKVRAHSTWVLKSHLDKYNVHKFHAANRGWVELGPEPHTSEAFHLLLGGPLIAKLSINLVLMHIGMSVYGKTCLGLAIACVANVAEHDLVYQLHAWSIWLNNFGNSLVLLLLLAYNIITNSCFQCL